MNAIHDLPVGIYAVGDEFLEKEGEVTLTFRGTTYRAVVGQTAFAHFGEMTQAAQAVPTEPFCGQSFDTPVAIVTTGGYT